MQNKKTSDCFGWKLVEGEGPPHAHRRDRGVIAYLHTRKFLSLLEGNNGKKNNNRNKERYKAGAVGSSGFFIGGTIGQFE